ncbi:DUF3857 domain-containing protein [Mucilaginibacter aquaedulcis]|uniref:DUF3857 domain-containing protein n=1 Tax=Mucilaginibacter aquaedulcis TaxID=1187081 RepID=UPI0025B405E4|nr:DUF3857 domain-containing protein [Mucilaginibacter aquaedulcis]MDN3550541.1 DUF3857 domain-containing protein [Mucilaginibacter aquaedulcis]
MNKTFTLLFLGCLAFGANAQTTIQTPTAQAFGKIDQSDLELKGCEFEKDANAEILFDKAGVYFDTNYNIVTDRHKRIKIFNDNGKSEANIRIEYYSANRIENISGLQAETINSNNGIPEITKIDKKQIFTEIVDKYRSAIVFSFPNVKPGSVIEFKYHLTSTSIGDFPDWYFQSHLPTRYSELGTNIPDVLDYKRLENVHYPYVVDKTNSSNMHIQALVNIPSLHDEPFMGSRDDNSERILFQLVSIKPTMGMIHTFSDTWNKVGQNWADDDDFGGQINRKLNGEEAIISKAKSLKTDDEKIAYVFNTVKNTLKWDEYNARYANDGTVKVWEKKIGNSAEINLILTHLLKKSGIKAYPMLVSTHNHGRVNPAYPNSYQFNSTVAYIPVDSNKYYVLDASNKYNIYNQVPTNFLNSFGLSVNKDDKIYELKFLDDQAPVRQVVLINAEIKPDGKMNGLADISSFSYNRINYIKKYKTDGEKKYLDYIRDDNNNLKIAAVAFENMEVDTLPLRQKMDFNLDLTGSDDNYIYFNSNLFTDLKKNPFLNENRVTDIDFGYKDNYSITGIFKLPAGFKVDALPKNITMMIPDKSIVFRRMVAEQDGSLMIRLTVDFKQSMYFKENYPEFREFYKKMYEMLNEQVVLKKS